jgi:hypothetical protein
MKLFHSSRRTARTLYDLNNLVPKHEINSTKRADAATTRIANGTDSGATRLCRLFLRILQTGPQCLSSRGKCANLPFYYGI